MGQSELLTALRRTGEEQAEAIRAKEAAEAEAVRRAAAARIEELRQAHEGHCAAAGAERRHRIMAEALRQAALIRLRGERDLALRLRQRAGACLVQLRDGGDGTLLAHLAAELPPATWAEIRVAPADTAPAAHLFPQALITAAPDITGGLVAMTRDGSLTVVNTLESRLEKGWPDLLPELVAEIREMAS